MSLVALIACSFLLAMPTGLAPLAMHQVTRNGHRGQLIAVYPLAATLPGLGAEPTLVAGVKNLPFGSDLKIGIALALVTTSVATAASSS